MTKLELTIGDTKVSWENPDEDLTVSELLDAFVGLMVAQTFQPGSIYNAMDELVGGATAEYVNQ